VKNVPPLDLAVKNIPPLDLTRQYKLIGEDLSAAVTEVLASGRYIGGSLVENFETQFAGYIGTQECVTCNSGTDALYLALRALQIQPGDEVITTAFTFIATTEAITLVGAKPVFIDIDVATFNFNPAQLAAAITEKTKAILPVHLFGNPTDMTAVMAIAEKHGLAVIEDCAQSTGATWAGKKTGSIGHIGCFSFFPTKNLGACGDGGAVTTNDPALAAKIRMLKEHGSRARYYHEEIGVNSRLDALQAAILQVKLRHLDAWNAQRQAVAERYHQLLNPVTGVQKPQAAVGGESVWNQYTVLIAGDSPANNGTESNLIPVTYRDRVRERMQERGVSSMVYYPLPLHLQSVYKNLGYQVGQLPVTEQVSHEVLSLPMFPELSPEEQEQVVYTLKDCLAL